MSALNNNDFKHFAENYHGKDARDIEGDTRNKRNWTMESTHSKKDKDKQRISYIKERKGMQRDEHLDTKAKLSKEDEIKKQREEETKENSNKRSNRRKEKSSSK